MWNSRKLSQNRLLISPESRTSFCSIATSPVLNQIVFTSYVGSRSTVYTHTKHIHHSMAETLQHRVLRSQKVSHVSIIKCCSTAHILLVFKSTLLLNFFIIILAKIKTN